MSKLPKKILPIDNPDKEFHEAWDDKRDMLNIPHPFRSVLLGPPNVGKTTVVKNLIIRQDPPFEEIFVFIVIVDIPKNMMIWVIISKC